MLTTDQRVRIEARLHEERSEAVDALRSYEEARQESLQDSTGELTLYRFHPADIGTEVMEREKQFLLESNEGRRLVEIDDALRRLYANPDQFGVCARCGRDIGVERLELVPATTFCAECQSINESAEA